MKIQPALAEVKQIAATGKYDVVPVSCEILSDFTTPIETMRVLKNVSTHCYKHSALPEYKAQLPQRAARQIISCWTPELGQEEPLIGS